MSIASQKKPYSSGIIAVTLIIIVSAFVVFPATVRANNSTIKKIGVLAKRGPEQCLAQWTPTADYLSARIPGYTFTIVPLDFEEINRAVETGSVDFVLANSAIYVELESLYGVSRILTLKNKRYDGAYTIFGGVIFLREDRVDINVLDDLKGKSFMGVKENSFGGWIMAWREMKEHGINPHDDLAELSFGGTHDAVVYAVRDGIVDAGTVRTDTLERMVMEGKINMTDYRVIHGHEDGHEHAGFPFLHSTRLYPEWPIAKVMHTPDRVAKDVAVALLNMQETSRAARAANITGWTPPLHYQPVRECLKYLRIGPYKNLGKVTFGDVLRQYWYGFVLTIFAMGLMGVFIAYVQRLNRRLKYSRDEVAKAKTGLEQRVIDRTEDLQRANIELNREATERKKREEFIRNIFESIDEGLIVIGKDYRIISVNRAYCDQSRKSAEDIVGKYCFQISHGSDAPCYENGEECPVKYTFATGKPQRVLHMHCGDDGNTVSVETISYPLRDLSGNVISAIEIMNDITERKRLEEQLLQAQKMEAIGLLAGGVAHDFNNILTAVMGHGSILETKMKSEDPLRMHVDEILTSAERAVSLTRSLLAFGSKQIINPQPMLLSEIITRIERLLSRIIGENIELKTFAPDVEAPVMADPSQVEQVLMNLCTNAKDAMIDGGLLMIESELVEIDHEYIKAHADMEPGTYMLVTVTDTGTGFADNMREKIFEPFFTTKEVGKGTGLGLSSAYGIMKQHNGYIDVYTEQGKGTAFKVYFPTVEGEVEKLKIAVLPPVVGGTETILFAEDETAVRELSRNILEEYGYTVILASDGAEALKQFKQATVTVDVLVLDVMMPKSTGKQAYDAINELMPGIKVLFISGYTADIIAKKGVLQQGTAFISKPYSPHGLLRKIREVLDA